MSHAQVLGRRKPLKGNSYIELPKPLALKKCIVNVKNTDDQCFKWDISVSVYECDTKKVGLKGDEWLTSKIGTKELSAPSYEPAI
jgi:hypothetical protein